MEVLQLLRQERKVSSEDCYHTGRMLRTRGLQNGPQPWAWPGEPEVPNFVSEHQMKMSKAAVAL